MALIVAGVSHDTAPLPLRERLVVSPSETMNAAERILEAAHAREAVLLSTCNRTEVYVVEGDVDAVPPIWSDFSAILGQDISPFGYVRRDRDAVVHLYRVTAGIDSMILGESQIHGQVRDAWERSRGAAGTVLNRLFQSALMVGGRVRSETSIGRGAASTSSAAVQLASKIFGSLRGRHAMVLGAGEMAELALECLVNEGVRTAIVANRTHERAEELAARYQARALHYDECWSSLADIDLLICSTAAPHAIVGVEQIAGSLKARGDRPLCILDIAVPRDVDPAVGALGNVFLYDVDDLRTVVTANIERRREELPAAESVIALRGREVLGMARGVGGGTGLANLPHRDGPDARSRARGCDAQARTSLAARSRGGRTFFKGSDEQVSPRAERATARGCSKRARARRRRRAPVPVRPSCRRFRAHR